MCNCGNKRNEFVSRQSFKPGGNQPMQQPQAKTTENIPFEYIGNTALTVTGNATGKRYRYTKKGEALLIDYRDSRGMMNVPLLKRIR